MGDSIMSKLRLYGDTSGHVDLTVPAVAGTTTIDTSTIVTHDGNGNLSTLSVNGQVGIGIAPLGDSALTVGGSNIPSYSSTIYMDNSNTGGSNGFVLTTDDTWAVKTNAGQGGLAIGTGVPGSGNVRIYVGTNGTITMGKDVSAYVASSQDSGTELHVTGPISFGQGNNQEWSKAGRRVLGWYSTTYHSSGSYTHLETNLWGGGSPNGNNDYIMGGFDIIGHRYTNGSSVAKHTIFFHNWSGSTGSGYSVTSSGNWDAQPNVYVGSNGYVYLRLPNSAYYGFCIDLYQFAWYPIRDIRVTAVHQNSTANM